MNPARIAAINRLVEAVAGFRNVAPYPQAAGDPATEYIAVLEAYDSLAAIPLDDPKPVKTRVSAPLTSRYAELAFRDLHHSYWARILRRLAYHSGVGMTVEELTVVLGGKHQTISARVNELRDAGWIYAPGSVRPTTSRREAEVYFLTTAARELIREVSP